MFLIDALIQKWCSVSLIPRTRSESGNKWKQPIPQWLQQGRRPLMDLPIHWLRVIGATTWQRCHLSRC